MKATDLRIGNWVLIGESTTPQLILSIEYKRDIKGNYAINGYECELFSGIKLTPDILNKANFNEDHYKRYRIKDYTYLIFTDKWELYTSRENNDLAVEVDLAAIKYLHEFQNWYKLLTGEELTVEL